MCFDFKLPYMKKVHISQTEEENCFRIWLLPFSSCVHTLINLLNVTSRTGVH